jgi:hypothetical protein
MKHLSVLIVAGLLAACQDQTPTGVDSRVAPISASFAATTADRTSAQSAIDDAVDRIAPALSDLADAQPLVAALRGLRVALDAGRASDGPALVRVARSELERYAQIRPADAPELDALGLALAVVGGTD